MITPVEGVWDGWKPRERLIVELSKLLSIDATKTNRAAFSPETSAQPSRSPYSSGGGSN